MPEATPEEGRTVVRTPAGAVTWMTVTATEAVADGITGTLVGIGFKVATTTPPPGMTEVMVSGTYVGNGMVVGRRV